MSAHANSDRKRLLFPIVTSRLLATALGLFTAALAEAQTATPPVGVPAANGAGGGASGLFVFLGVMVVLFAVVAVIVKMMDRRRKRNEEAVQLQARIADAMLLDPMLGKLALTASVTAPLSGSPLAVEVHGEAPSPEIRDEALRLVIREATASALPFHVQDRVTVGTPGAARRAA
jgi:hypothetical protein